MTKGEDKCDWCGLAITLPAEPQNLILPRLQWEVAICGDCLKKCEDAVIKVRAECLLVRTVTP